MPHNRKRSDAAKERRAERRQGKGEEASGPSGSTQPAGRSGQGGSEGPAAGESSATGKGAGTEASERSEAPKVEAEQQRGAGAAARLLGQEYGRGRIARGLLGTCSR